MIGSGPNGLAAAIALAQAGLQVEVREARAVAGGAVHSDKLTLPGFTHDVMSAVYPMTLSSPFFRGLGLNVDWIHPDAPVAHPLDDGTAVMLQVIHAYGSRDTAFDYLKKLQDNNVGPSASTGKLTALVNKGELYVANGDLQMNMSQMTDNPNIKVFWPAGPNGERSAMPLPYYVGLVAGAPDADNGKKLIEFLLSKDAQGAVSSVALGMPVRKDVTPTDSNFTKLHDAMQGVTIWTPGWAQVLKDLPADVGRWKQATGS